MPNFFKIGGNLIRLDTVTAIRPLNAAGEYKPRIAVDLMASSDNPACVVVEYDTVEIRDLVMESLERVILA